MKTLIFSLLLISITNRYFAQVWSKEELEKANTCKLVDELEENEKEAIMYINLARIYPKKFAKIALSNYWGPIKYNRYLEESTFKESLMDRLLNDQNPMPALNWNEELQAFAACFAQEQGANGHMGHQRKKCEKGYFYECCAYDMETGIDIAMQLLIDHNVESLGHREICLNPELKFIGIKFNTHKKANFCAVLDLN